MSNEELIHDFTIIEEEIRGICKTLKGIFEDISVGEVNNLKTAIDGNYDICLSRGGLNEFPAKLKEAYVGKADTLEKKKFLITMGQCRSRIYSDDQEAKHIVSRVLILVKGRVSWFTSFRINKLLNKIISECNALARVEGLITKLIDELKKYSPKGNAVEELERAVLVYKKMQDICNKGDKIVNRIYSDDNRAEHIFARLKRLL